MKAEFNISGTGLQNGHVTFYREPGDPKFYGYRGAKGEHALFHFIAKWLNARGFCLTKVRAEKDGHMIGDQFQPIIRPPKSVGKNKVEFPHIGIYNPRYAIDGANDSWNKDGEVTLFIVFDYWYGVGKGRQDTRKIMRKMKRNGWTIEKSN